MKTKKKMLTISTALTALFLPIIVTATAGSPTITQIQRSGDETDVETMLDRIIEWIFLFVGFLAVLFVIWGGILYLTAAGNSEQAKKGRQTLTYAIIGLVIVILSYFIVAFVANVVDYIIPGGGN